VASSPRFGKLALMAVGMLLPGRGDDSVGDVARRSRTFEVRGRRFDGQTRRLVAYLEPPPPAAYRDAALWPEVPSKAQKTSSQPEGAVREGYALVYYCTIQVANEDALRFVLLREGSIFHKCPTSTRTLRLTVEQVWHRGRRCGCGNRDCWVYQYTDNGPTSKEHGAA
jgi:hypothetical protein